VPPFDINLTTVTSVLCTLIGAAIILGKQLQIIKQLTARVNQLERTVAELTTQLVRFSTILEERTRFKEDKHG